MSESRKTIAVVEDDASMLRGIDRLLSAYGFATEMYTSGEAFLSHAATSEARCLLVDIHLSGISGIELKRQLRALGWTFAVIFMTAVDDEATRTAAMQAGCTAYLRKPFAAQALVEAIGAATGE